MVQLAMAAALHGNLELPYADHLCQYRPMDKVVNMARILPHITCHTPKIPTQKQVKQKLASRTRIVARVFGVRLRLLDPNTGL